MKQQVKHSIERKLAASARQVLAVHKPSVVAVTGSTGKTSTKDAIATVLANKHDVRASQGNYNNELGLPLTIVGERSPRKQIFGWWQVLRSAKKAAKPGSFYPKTVVLEMAIDRPGDMQKLVAIARPNIGVVTNVGESHLEFFESVAAIAKEKSAVVTALGPEGVAVLNADNIWTREMQQLHTGKTFTFGITHEADFRASNIRATEDIPESGVSSSLLRLKGLGVPLGTAFTLTFAGKSVSVQLPGMLGVPQVYSALAAAAVGVASGMSLDEIAQALVAFVPPKGRMNLIPGVKDALIIDDTYNSAPDSAIAALDVLGQLKPAGRRIAVLGDMAELGTATEEGHKKVGEYAARTCDFAVFVGPKSKWSAEAAETAGLADERQTHVMDSRQVEAVLQTVMRAGDVLLVKGSQLMRMEHVVKALMAEPERADELLVRQTEGWENK